jgi:hypothetical protein
MNIVVNIVLDWLKLNDIYNVRGVTTLVLIYYNGFKNILLIHQLLLEQIFNMHPVAYCADVVSVQSFFCSLYSRLHASGGGVVPCLSNDLYGFCTCPSRASLVCSPVHGNLHSLNSHYIYIYI